MKKYTYQTIGTCSRQIDFAVDNGVITYVTFVGGCHGNLQGISRLVEGMTPAAAIARLRGIRCGTKPTSCPDQLACALSQAVDK